MGFAKPDDGADVKRTSGMSPPVCVDWVGAAQRRYGQRWRLVRTTAVADPQSPVGDAQVSDESSDGGDVAPVASQTD